MAKRVFTCLFLLLIVSCGRNSNGSGAMLPAAPAALHSSGGAAIEAPEFVRNGPGFASNAPGFAPDPPGFAPDETKPLQLSMRELVLTANGSPAHVKVRSRQPITGRIASDSSDCNNIVKVKPLQNAAGNALFQVTPEGTGWCVVTFRGGNERGTLTVGVDEGLLTFSLTIPAHVPKKPPVRGSGGFITPAAKSLGVSLNGGPQVAIGLTPATNPNCLSRADSSIVCSGLSVGASTSQKVVVSLALYNQSLVNGRIPKRADVLANWSSKKLAVELSASNPVPDVDFDGVVRVLSISAISPGTLGTSGRYLVFVNPSDGSGQTVSGTFANGPITLTDSDKTGATQVSAPLYSSAQIGNIQYNGGPIASATITAKVNSPSASASQTFYPKPVLTSISRSSAGLGRSGSVTLTGQFDPNATNVTIAPATGGVTVSALSSTTTSLTAMVTIPSTATVGAYTISVNTGSNVYQKSGTVAFQVASVVNDVVTLTTDSAVGSTPGICPAGQPGDLRYAICNALGGDLVLFNCGSACKIVLAAPLPPVQENLTINGGTLGAVTIDGGSKYRIFWLESGIIAIENLALQNALTHGGNGGAGGPAGTCNTTYTSPCVGAGGGGAGVGAGMFIHTAAVTLTNVAFTNMSAVGGNGGGALSSYGGGGGGGGLGGNGGDGAVSYGGYGFGGGGGGGGVLGAGLSAQSNLQGTAGNGGYGGGAAGVGASAQPGPGYAGNPGGSGQNGGFGGGCGGGEFDEGSTWVVPNPAFGAGWGGGGCGYWFTNGGMGENAGDGGGGGGGFEFSGAPALATLAGGAGTNDGAGGGTAGGPAILNFSGSLTTQSSYVQNATATPGVSSATGVPTALADATPVFNFEGTVNGSTTAGPVASALINGAPPMLRRITTARHARTAGHIHR